MKKFKLLILSCCLGASLQALPVFAAGVTPYTQGRLLTAERYEQKGDLNKAIATLNETKTKSNYDKAFVARMLGIYYWQQQSSAKSIASLNKALDYKVLDSEATWQTRRMLADILYSEQKSDQAIKHYQALLSSGYKPSAAQRADFYKDLNQIHFRLAAAFYQKEDWAQSVKYLSKFKPEDNKQKIQSLQMKLYAQTNLKQWSGVDKTVNELIRLEPNNKNWWQQQIYAQVQAEQYKKAVSTYSLAKQQGIEFSASDYQMLAQLYAQNGIYEKAARVYSELFKQYPKEQTLANLQTQANYWQMGKDWDKAIGAWQTLAQQSGKFYWPLTQLLTQQGEYEKALAVVDKAKPYASADDYALAKVNILYKLERYDDALANAKRFHERAPSDSVQTWIGFLESKIAMQQEVKQNALEDQAEQVAQIDTSGSNAS